MPINDVKFLTPGDYHVKSVKVVCRQNKFPSVIVFALDDGTELNVPVPSGSFAVSSESSD